MFPRIMLTLLALWLDWAAVSAQAQRIVPSALLTIDQNRATVVERIVGEWGDRLTASNAGINAAQLREILSGLRADHLLAASLAGSMEGLRDVVSGALVHTDAAVSPALMHTKALGDTGDDLVYTPVVPCRILDTRNGTTPPYNAQMAGGSAFPVAANLANFAPQGGAATSCNLPTSFAAIAVTLTVLNPNFDAFLAASNSSNFAILVQSVVMDFSANKGLANTAIVPVDGTVKFYLGLPAQVTTHVIADAVGYLRRPTNYGGTHVINSAAYATDSGGYQNTASGGSSTVAGGADNTASGDYGTVGGGEFNTASGGDSTVAGGFFNTASGSASTVVGGYNNTASGDGSFAAGASANAMHNGSFVWGDGIRAVNSTGTNTFTVLATGGISLYPATGQCLLTTGVGGWSCTSDRNAKENFTTLNARDLLQRLSAVPIMRWNAKGAPGVQHIGPMAQDFRAAFGLGEDDRHIGTTDAQGVALAAIQGLHQLIKQKDAKLRTQDSKLHEQSNRIATMERELATIKEKLSMR